jgi:putative hydrolase of the HAD superfamily
MLIKAVLFDMFDTLALIDNNYEFYNHAIERMHKYITIQGVNVDYKRFHRAYNEARDELYIEADKTLDEPHFNQRVQNALQKVGFSFDIEDSTIRGAVEEFCQEFLNHVTIDENATAVLQKLHGNYKLGVVSNFAIPEGVYKPLKTSKLEKFFDVIIVSVEVNKRKPSPEIFQTALKKIEVVAEDAVFIGDTADADVAGAHAIGMKAIYIKRRFEQAIEEFTPDIIIESLAQLPDALKIINNN